MKRSFPSVFSTFFFVTFFFFCSSLFSSKTLAQSYFRKVGLKEFELKNHLSNVEVIVADKKTLVDPNNSISGFNGSIICYNHYFPFGMNQPERNYSAPSYRFGYNGMEKDNEQKGEGNSYTTTFRQYDPRSGRWLSMDPKNQKSPSQSPYSSFYNNPVLYNDPKGDIPPGKSEEDIFSDRRLRYAQNGCLVVSATALSVAGIAYVGGTAMAARVGYWMFRNPVKTVIITGTVEATVAPPGYQGPSVLEGLPSGASSVVKTAEQKLAASIEKAWIKAALELLEVTVKNDLFEKFGVKVFKDQMGWFIFKIGKDEIGLLTYTGSTGLIKGIQKVPVDIRRNGLSTEMFKTTIELFEKAGSAVKGILGEWHPTGPLNKNHELFNEAFAGFAKEIESGRMTLAEALRQSAFATATGKIAKELGYNNVKVVLKDVEKGTKGSIEAIFTK